jgi:hypothetical protein
MSLFALKGTKEKEEEKEEEKGEDFGLERYQGKEGRGEKGGEEEEKEGGGREGAENK